MPRLALFALVLAALQPAVAHPAAPARPAPTEADWRTPDPANLLLIETTKGRIIVELLPLVAPVAVDRVRSLARTGFYDGLTFFRVVGDFMAQTGDPKNTGEGGSTQPDLAPEFSFRRDSATPITVITSEEGIETGYIGSLPVTSQTMQLAALTADGKVRAYGDYCPGVVGMARAQTPGSANSQFFLMRGAARTLDQSYTPIGRVIVGLDVVRAIKTGEPVAAPQDKMISVKIVADLPPAQRPKVRVINPAGPWMKSEVERVKNDKVVGFSLCDVDIPAEVH